MIRVRVMVRGLGLWSGLELRVRVSVMVRVIRGLDWNQLQVGMKLGLCL